ncbi:MAG TPA: hypothetical protein DCK95_12400 [Anaerolineaceae bacterium]|nr:hypothetical protein [Anaerolineaceae bacterium]
MDSKIIIMLTNNDSTVPNALEVFEECKDLPIDFWGFKDVGLEKPKMKQLVSKMKEAGKTTFLEVVSYPEDECMTGAKTAVEFGYDYLMGTVFHQSVFDYLRTQEIKFLPFCGKIYGHPSILDGSIEEIISDANFLLDKGVDGIDLLAFRHETGAKLAEEYCKQIQKPVVIAGSINSKEKIEFINRINPWAFTMGTALFNENFAPGKGFRKNLEIVIEFMNRLN